MNVGLRDDPSLLAVSPQVI